MIRRRWISLLVPGAAVAALASFLVVPPAEAVVRSGLIGVKSSGTLYTASPATANGLHPIVSEAVAAGGTATYEVRVLNTGTTLSQYRLRMETFRGHDTPDPGLSGSLTSGTVKVTELANAPEGYFTKPLAAGKYEDLVLKVTVPKLSPPTTTVSRIVLSNPGDGVVLGEIEMRTELALPSTGNPGTGVVARQGSQLFVGRPGAQLATSAGIKVGSSVSFEVRLVNQAATPSRVGGEMFSENLCTTLQVKDGTVDVTAALRAGAYVTPVLATGAYRKLTVTFKRTVAAGCAPYNYATFESFTGGVAPRQTTGFVATVVPQAM